MVQWARAHVTRRGGGGERLPKFSSVHRRLHATGINNQDSGEPPDHNTSPTAASPSHRGCSHPSQASQPDHNAGRRGIGREWLVCKLQRPILTAECRRCSAECRRRLRGGTPQQGSSSSPTNLNKTPSQQKITDRATYDSRACTTQRPGWRPGQGMEQGRPVAVPDSCKGQLRRACALNSGSGCSAC